MKSARSVGLLVLLVTAGLSAAPAEEADRFVRQGDAAFEQGDWQAALDAYRQAEERSVDPGLVAFNEAAALYRLGRYREAELHYLRCRDDAAGERRARVEYDLANAIVQQAQDRDAKRLEEAIASYEDCLRRAPAGSELAEAAGFNLRLARALLVQAKAAKDRPKSDNPDNTEANPPPQDQAEDRRPGGDFRPGSADRRGTARGMAQRIGNGSGEPASTSQPPAPGIGNLPVLPDTDQLVPLSAEDTVAYLDQVAARVLRERREHRQRSAAPPSPLVKDW